MRKKIKTLKKLLLNLKKAGRYIIYAEVGLFRTLTQRYKKGFTTKSFSTILMDFNKFWEIKKGGYPPPFKNIKK